MSRISVCRYPDTNRGSRGFTLTELAIVLVVISAITAGILVAMNAISNNRMVNQTADQLGIIVSNLRSLYSGQALPSASIAAATATPTFITQNVFPNEMVSGTNVINVWKGAVTVGVVVAGNTATQFDVQYQNIPLDTCVQILTQNSQPGRDTGLVQVKLTDSTSATQTFVTDATTHDLPIAPLTASAACSGHTPPFTIDWFYVIGNGCAAGAAC